jgi:hypothetical protein
MGFMVALEWVERSETHHLQDIVMVFASSNYLTNFSFSLFCFLLKFRIFSTEKIQKIF